MGIQEEIHHFAGWGGGGVKGRKSCEQKSFEQTGVFLAIVNRLLIAAIAQEITCEWAVNCPKHELPRMGHLTSQQHLLTHQI